MIDLIADGLNPVVTSAFPDDTDPILALVSPEDAKPNQSGRTGQFMAMISAPRLSRAEQPRFESGPKLSSSMQSQLSILH